MGFLNLYDFEDRWLYKAGRKFEHETLLRVVRYMN